MLTHGAPAVQVKARTEAAQYESAQGEVIRLDQADRFGDVTVSATQGVAVAKFNIKSKHLLGGAELVGSNPGGYLFVVEELLEGPGITAERNVRWYDHTGNLKGIYEVPFMDYYAWPTTDLAFDRQSGAIYNMIVRKETIEPWRIGNQYLDVGVD